jgi:hypothetical protein
VALKKSDLYSSLWQSCDELRGGMDASQYKDYILTLLFVKYVTDKSKSDSSSLIVVPEGGSFDDLPRSCSKSENLGLNDRAPGWPGRGNVRLSRDNTGYQDSTSRTSGGSPIWWRMNRWLTS